MSSLLVVSSETSDGVLTVRCSGELHEALEVASLVEAAVVEGCLRVSIDCRELSGATADGMRDLLSAINRCDEAHIPVELILPSGGERLIDLVDISSEANDGSRQIYQELYAGQGERGQRIG